MSTMIFRFLLFVLIHSLLATDAVKRLVCRTPLISRSYRLLYNLFALGSFAWVMTALPGSPALYTISGVPAVVLRGVQLSALVILCRCAAQTGLAEFLGVRQLVTGTEETQRFTRDGCYRHVRHPQYTLAVVALLAAPTVSVNYALFTLLTTLYFVLGSFIEETRLVMIFGDDYRRYRREVPMFVPNPINLYRRVTKGSQKCS